MGMTSAGALQVVSKAALYASEGGTCHRSALREEDGESKIAPTPRVLPFKCNIYIISSVCVPTNLRGGWQGTVQVRNLVRQI
jgi:hypothetical protein